MKMFKTIPMFILLFTGSLVNAQDETSASMEYPAKKHVTESSAPIHNPTQSLGTEDNNHVPAGRGLPTLVVAGVSIALVLLFILIVAVFWYAWKKSQEGSIELNPIPYGEPGVSLRTVSVSEN